MTEQEKSGAELLLARLMRSVELRSALGTSKETEICDLLLSILRGVDLEETDD